MTLPPSQPSTCAQCGQPVNPGKAAVGCLQCLLGGIVEDEAACLRDSPQPPSTDVAGRYHHYEILRREDGACFELGRGGMGVTYKAMDVNLRVPVALKIIDADYAAHPRARDLFLREARSAARLRHPNVATVYHFGTREPDPTTVRSLVDEDLAGTACFYAMEFVDGETLDARVRRTGPLPPSEVLEIALQIARALVAAEERGLVHRDLKPANVMLAGDAAMVDRRRERAWVKVIDFGLAKAVSAALADGSAYAPATAGPVTHGAFVGTPGFASPEQFELAELDVRSDMYSLGATLWFALTGHLPHEGDTLAEVHDRQTHRPLPVAQLTDVCTPPPLIELLTKMLAPDPARRPASARALCESVETCLTVVQGEPRRQRQRLALVMAALVLLGGLATLAVFHPWTRAVVIAPFAPIAPPKAAGPAVPEKSLAVLPFEDLSAGKDNASLTEGVQDELLTNLAKVADLKVISRSSVMQFKAGEPRKLDEIATQLGVTYLVEGSVQHTGNRVRVNAQLIDTRTSATPWAEHYDRSLEDAFVLQSDIAQDVAHQLQVALSPGEKRAIEAPATTDLQAYNLYLRARYIYQNSFGNAEHLPEAVSLLNEAVGRDPKFVRAWCLLSDVHTQVYRKTIDRTLARIELARTALDHAQALAPDDGEVHLSRVLFASRCLHDQAQAVAELEIAHRLLPNSPTVYVYRSDMHVDPTPGAAVRDLERAFALDPRDRIAGGKLGSNYRDIGRYDEAVRVVDRQLALRPGDPELRMERGQLDVECRADCRRYQTTLAEIIAEDPTKVPGLILPDVTLCARTPESAALLLAYFPHESADQTEQEPYGYWEGIVARWQGDATRARAAFTAARASVVRMLAVHPEDSQNTSLLGLIDAGLGNKAEALAEGRQACELKEAKEVPNYGRMAILALAEIEAWTGEKVAALDHLESLRGKHCNGYTYGLLKLCPTWDPLRGEPRFEAQVASLAPKDGH